MLQYSYLIGNTLKKQKIYIAGPDVFEPDAIEIGKKHSQSCFDLGFIGLYPLDNTIDFDQDKPAVAQEIYRANLNLIDDADIVIANMNPFRGREADSGTVWEIGYAIAKNKTVVIYLSEGLSYIDKFGKYEKIVGDRLGEYVDLNGKYIEDFDLPFNLMIACSVDKIVIGGFEDALNAVSIMNIN